jgi:hypothetical protein
VATRPGGIRRTTDSTLAVKSVIGLNTETGEPVKR